MTGSENGPEGGPVNPAPRRRRRGGSILRGFLGLCALATIALAADLLAADLPLAVRVDGRTHVLPCLTRPASLRDEDQPHLAARAAWMIGTPVGYGPLASHPGGITEVLAPPSKKHLLGTDDRGRDVAARMIHGARTALSIGALAILLTLLFGGAVGLASASSPLFDRIAGRLVEVALVFPSYFLLLAIQGAMATRGGRPAAASFWEVAGAIALTRWAEAARLVRVEALRQLASPHVEAARALGAGPLAIAWRHVLPLSIQPLLVAGAFGVGQAVLIEAGLAFLGLGAPPPTPTWGELLAEAQGAGLPWWLVAPPALAIALTVQAASHAAERLRRLLNPRCGERP